MDHRAGTARFAGLTVAVARVVAAATNRPAGSGPQRA
jgi:hypothetical protein